MQKIRSNSYIYFQENLNKDFPVYYVLWTQKHTSLNDLHYHNCAEIGICLKGNGVFFIRDKVYPFHKNTVSFINEGQPHIAQSPDSNPSEWIFIFFQPEYWNLPELPKTHVLTNHKEYVTCVNMLVSELNRPDEPLARKSIEHLLSLLSIGFCRCQESNKGDQELLSQDFHLISPAISYISLHYTDEITVNKMAELCGFSTGHFSKLFRQSTGMTPKSYLDTVRITMSENYLTTTELPILEIAGLSGFGTLSSFNRLFQQRHHQSPREFRKQHR